jgi:hypothetical protein
VGWDMYLGMYDPRGAGLTPLSLSQEHSQNICSDRERLEYWGHDLEEDRVVFESEVDFRGSRPRR